MNQVKQVLGSQWFHSLWHTLLGGALGYLTTNAFAPTKSWYVGLVTAVIGAFVGWLNGTPSDATSPTTPPVAQSSKTSMVLIGFLLLACSPTFANPLTAPISVMQGGEDLWGFAPIGAIEFNPSNSNNYGLALSESIFFGHVVPNDDTHVVVSPYFFTGLFAAANIGQWAQSNGNANISVDYGVMIGLPKLDSTLPEVAFSATWNTINRGDAKLFIDVAFPADILSNILVHRL